MTDERNDPWGRDRMDDRNRMWNRDEDMGGSSWSGASGQPTAGIGGARPPRPPAGTRSRGTHRRTETGAVTERETSGGR